MFNNFFVTMMLIMLIYQYTTTLQQQQQQQKICGTEYFKETIGISIANDRLYQFLYINDTIKIIFYDYRKLIKNNDEKDYKLNLNNGQFLPDGLKFLISSYIVQQLMIVIKWPGDRSDSNKKPIISIGISINDRGERRIYCLKTFNYKKYYIGDYSQRIDPNKIELFSVKYEQPTIMGIISDRRGGLIIFSYDKQSYYLQMKQLSPKKYGQDLNFEWIKALVVDKSKTFVYAIDEKKKLSQQQQQTLMELFEQTIGQYEFTYGYIDGTKMLRFYLFTNRLEMEKFITFSANFIREKADKENRYHFFINSVQYLFYCNKQITNRNIIENSIKNKLKLLNNTNYKRDKREDKFQPSFLPKTFLSLFIIVFVPLLLFGLIVNHRRQIKRTIDSLTNEKSLSDTTAMNE